MKLITTQTLPETGCTRQEIYDLIESVNPGADLVNSDVLQVLANKITAGDRLPFWRKWTVGHAALQTVSMTNNIELFQLPAGGAIHALKVKHSTAFAGTGITDYKVSVGIAGTLQKFIADFDVDSAVSATNERIAWAPFWASLAPAAFGSVDGAVSGAVTQAAGAVAAAVTQADGVIAALTISAAYSQAEVQALRAACETLGDNTRALAAVCETLGDNVRALAAACETLADDARASRASLAALFAGAIGSENHGAATSIRLSATAVGGNLSASTAGTLDIWGLYSVET